VPQLIFLSELLLHGLFIQIMNTQQHICYKSANINNCASVSQDVTNNCCAVI